MVVRLKRVMLSKPGLRRAANGSISRWLTSSWAGLYLGMETLTMTATQSWSEPVRSSASGMFAFSYLRHETLCRTVLATSMTLVILFWTSTALAVVSSYTAGAVTTAPSTNGTAAITLPDVCKTPRPAGPIPIPYPNSGKSTDTSQGPRKVQLRNGAQIEIKQGETRPGEPNVTIKNQGKTFFATYSFDVSLDGASGSGSVTSGESGLPRRGSSLPVLQTTDGQAVVVCDDELYAATLFPVVPVTVEFIDPPLWDGPVFPYRSGRIPTPEEQAEYQANQQKIDSQQLQIAEELGAEHSLLMDKMAPQRAAVLEIVEQYVEAHPVYNGFPVTIVEHVGEDGLFEYIELWYGTTADSMYVARFDGQGNLVQQPVLTAAGQAWNTIVAYRQPGSTIRLEETTDIYGNKYIAKVEYSNGGGYWLFNEKGFSYWGQVFNTETGGGRGVKNDDKNYPVLSDRGEPLLELPLVRLASTRCPVPCQPFVDVYNSIALEMNWIIGEMNDHAFEHTFDNEKARSTEENYAEYLKSPDHDKYIGPDPGIPAPTSLIQKHRLRYEELQRVLREFEPRLEEARTNLELCRCPGQAPNMLMTVAQWGQPYTTGPAASGCLAATSGLAGLSTNECGASEATCSAAISAAELPPACVGSPLESWVEFDCGSGCDDVAVATTANWQGACQGSGYPIGSDSFAFPAGSCNLGQLNPGDYEQGTLRTSQAGAADPAYAAAGAVRPGLPDQWGLQRIAASTGGGVPTLPADSTPVLVAVIDSGLDLQHPDLLGQVWSNPGEIPGNGVDDDGNGLIDDINGWNFVRDNNDTRDSNGHGTLVAGIIGAQRDNGFGMAGVNPLARLMPIKVTNFAGNGNSVDLAAAITYAARAGARVINISLGGETFSPAEQSAALYAIQQGALLVIAAGNLNINTEAFWPAGLDGVITVAAIDPDDQRASYSNWGSAVDIAAPGTDILSLRARYTDLMFFADRDYKPESNIVGADRMLYHASGTSFAAPFVSGVASLLFSLNPQLTAAQVRRMILNSAADIANPGNDLLTGYGLLDATAALKANPAYFINAGVTGVALAGDSQSIVVTGTADADRFKSARLELGQGEVPAKWKSVGRKIKKPVSAGELGSIKTRDLAGSNKWTIRLTVQHRDGSERVSWFLLSLG